MSHIVYEVQCMMFQGEITLFFALRNDYVIETKHGSYLHFLTSEKAPLPSVSSSSYSVLNDFLTYPS